jgi:hypothetical protein
MQAGNEGSREEGRAVAGAISGGEESEKRFDVAELYTIADVWGWTWERELRELEPEEWSQEKEVQLGIEIMFKVIRLLHTH